jgi:hypothetical protein
VIQSSTVRVLTKVVLDIETLAVLEIVALPYEGAWELCKGGNSQAAMQQAAQVSQQQLAMQQQMMNLITPSLTGIIQNGGLLPSTQAAMTGTALNTLGTQYQDLYGQLSSSLAARGMTGGMNAGAGGVAANFGALGAAQAGQATQALEGIQQAKAQGLQSALGMGLSGAAATGQTGVGALGQQVTAANAADQAQTGFWGSLVGGLAGLGGNVAKAAAGVA